MFFIFTSGQTGLPVEEIATIAHEDSKDMEATEQESIDLHQSEQGKKDNKNIAASLSYQLSQRG